MSGSRHHTDDGADASGERPSLLRFLCERCTTTFHTKYDFCPRCMRPRPSEGWRPTRDFPDAWLGRRIGRYRVEQRLGQGAAAAVYRASRPHLDDTYAFKVINLDLAEGSDQGPSLRERVEREVRILSSISSPHIVGFHDFLELRGGSVAVVMDYVPGKTLGHLLDGDDEPFALERALQFAIEIASGLRDAHRHGVVHRDLKPDNVMVHDLGGRGEFVELIDFGVARFESEASRTVGFIGTPRYTSPEQARGESVDTSSDIYNLGMLLFHMCAGHPPYVQESVNDLLQAHSRQEAPHLSAASDREIPPELDALVQQMMAKAPADRPAETTEVLERLRTVQSQIAGDASESDPARTQLGADSAPESIAGDSTPGVGSVHRTDDYHPLSGDEEPRESDEETVRPPSDVFDVSDRGSILYRDEDNRLRVRHTMTAGRPRELDDQILAEFSTPVTALAVDETGRALLGYRDGSLRDFDVDSGRVVGIEQGRDTGPVAAIACTPDGKRIVVGYQNGEVRFRDPKTRSDSGWQSLPGGDGVVSVGIHDDGSCIAISRRDATTEVFVPARSTRERCSLIDHDVRPEMVDFSPDGYLVAIQFPDGSAHLYSALTGHHVSQAPQQVLQPSGVFDAIDD